MLASAQMHPHAQHARMTFLTNLALAVWLFVPEDYPYLVDTTCLASCPSGTYASASEDQCAVKHSSSPKSTFFLCYV